MLNQFYNYLAHKLNNYFESVTAGERFYLQFDDAEKVKEFYETLRTLPQTERFTYQHKYGTLYDTFMIKHDVDIVIAATLGGVTPDYLVTLRNEVSEQKNQWENKALLIICSQTLDSIKGGSSDLQKEGMPFHVDQLTKHITEEIVKSKLKDIEKEILKFHLEQKRVETLFKTNLWDYQEVLGFIYSGEIAENTYSKLNLFKDDALDTYTILKMRKRIKENADLFEKISNAHNFDDVENRLGRFLSDNGVSKLKNENWTENQFKDVNKYVEEFNEQKKESLGYLESANKLTVEMLEFWERPLSEKGNKKNKRQILVFNPQGIENITLKFSFDDFLKSEFLDSKSKLFTKTSGKKLELSLTHEKGTTSFHKSIYNHNKNPKTRFQFDICIVETNPENFNGIKTKYEVNGAKGSLELQCDYTDIYFGPQKEGILSREVNEPGEEIKVDEFESFRISEDSQGWENDTLSFVINFYGVKVPIRVKDENNKVVPIDSSRIWKLKRESMEDFYYNELSGNLIQGAKEYSTYQVLRPFIRWEKEWIQETMYAAKLDGEDIRPIELSLPKEIESAFRSVLEWYRGKDSSPTLAYLSNDIKERMRHFITLFNSEVERIEERSFLSKEQKNLSKLGVMMNHQKVYISPFHPLMMAYQLEIMERLECEQLENHILERLQPNNLLPYIYGESDAIYKVVVQNTVKEWLVYEPDEKVSVGETNSYLAMIVKDKLNQFLEHFKYLFMEGSKAPMKINIVDLKNDKEIVRGLISFLKDIIENKGVDDLFPLEISIYGMNGMFSEFERFSSYDSPELIKTFYDIDLDSSELDPTDMLRLIRDNIIYSKHKVKQQFKYAHISFYKMKITDEFTDVDQTQMSTGLSLNGLLSSLPSYFAKDDYRSGFGIKDVLDSNMNIPRTARNLNELMANMKKDGKDTFKKNISISSITSSYDHELLKKIYDASHWVTFVDPNVGLDFFNNSQDELVIIHYSDQYSSSSKLDSITVTNKVAQYKQAVENFLVDKNIKPDDKGIEEAIQSFNSLNGEWLLRMIGRKDHFSREKLSIISAIKAVNAILQHNRITWVPVSLEEVLRVAGAVKLKKAEGIFSAKNLLSEGVHSDDLLLIGVEETPEELRLHYYPVEVKVGVNSSTTTSKAEEQLKKTSELISKELAFENEEGVILFKNKFYRNFFVQILFSNMEKMKTQRYYRRDMQDKINRWKKYLLNDDYKISTALHKYIGFGALVSFKKDQIYRRVQSKDILYVTLAEEDAYRWVLECQETIVEGFQSEKYEIPKEVLLSNLYREVSTGEIRDDDLSKENEMEGIDNNRFDSTGQVKSSVVEVEEKDDSIISSQGVSDYNTPASIEDNEERAVQEASIRRDGTISDTEVMNKLSEIRVLIGTAEGSTKKVYWEYGHKQLANRHILISGKSGQGKSYFIQCLLAELTQQGMNSVIFDYTDGFKTGKLEPKFKEVLGDKIQQFLVAINKFPINPFQKNKKVIDEDIFLDEDAYDVAERIKSVLGSVYKNLGIQQLNAIYDSVVEGINTFGEYMHFGHLLDGLEENGSPSAKTAASTIKPLIDKNPFDHRSKFSWGQAFGSNGKVFIIQLAGFTRDVQLIITELILWDLWNYKVHEGSEGAPFSVILDEAQNLDHTEKSPSARILTEGRKFGWSGWYATQFMKGSLGSDEIMRLQNSGHKIYFSPPDAELPSIASYLSTNPIERKDWEKVLKELRKGQCVSVGPMRQEDGSLKTGDPVVVNVDSLDSRYFK